MKLALAQINTTVGDLRGNSAKILQHYRLAQQAGVDLLLTPELAITGYPPRDLLSKRRFVRDNLATLDEIAGQVGETGLLVGFVDFNPAADGRPYYNSVALVYQRKIVARRSKTLLPTYDVFDEDRYFQPSERNDPIEWKGCRLGVTVCEDIWNVEHFAPTRYNRDPVSELAGVDYLLNLSASPYHLGKARVREQLVQAVATKHRMPVAYCNLVGGNDELIFDGQSMVFNATGQMWAQAAAFREELLIVDTSGPAAPPLAPTSDMAGLHDALVLGLRDYAGKCGFRSAVLGLSGGIDSAVTACLAAEALGNSNVLGVSLPSQFSSPASKDDARILAANLGIRYEVIPIQAAFEQLKATLQPLFAGRAEDTTEENLQARVRGTLLMALSNKFGHPLLTTGNKSEMAVGYCTLYGDMNGGLAVIADVPKTMVYELARYINRERAIIPASSITKPPSAELRPNQTDQDTLPEYAVLDAILKRYVEENKSAAEIIEETGYDAGLVRDIVRKIDLNEYKRKQAPPCLRVTTKAFGIGRRVPIAQRYVER
jgi:NAD+ synthase/NAD+ synthase (glutamine-hydrolysing)